MEPPLEAVSPEVAAVTMAVTLGARSVRQVMIQVEARSFRMTFDALREARQLGLVDWIDGTAGTLHPTMRITAASPR